MPRSSRKYDLDDMAAEGGEMPPAAASLAPSNPYERDVWSVLGVPIDAANIDMAVSKIDQSIAYGDQLSFVTPNVNWLVRSTKCEIARGEITNADLSLADGAPIAVMARALGIPIKSRVAGSDLFEALRRRPPFGTRRVSVFFFGGRDGSAKAASEALQNENSGLISAGWLNPGFGSVDEMSTDEIIEEINAANPDFVVVALGASKGQAWIQRNQDRLNTRVVAHLGAVVDFTSGQICRAPKIVQKLGLEWAWRIKEEPSLWRRYASDGMSLAQLFVSRFTPVVLALRAQRSAGAPELRVARSAGETRIVLSGDHRQPELSSVRAAFWSAERRGEDVAIDVKNLGRIDMALVGLILLLEQRLKRQGRKLAIIGANSGQKVIFSANGLAQSANSAPAEPVIADDAVSAAG